MMKWKPSMWKRILEFGVSTRRCLLDYSTTATMIHLNNQRVVTIQTLSSIGDNYSPNKVVFHIIVPSKDLHQWFLIKKKKNPAADNLQDSSNPYWFLYPMVNSSFPIYYSLVFHNLDKNCLQHATSYLPTTLIPSLLPTPNTKGQKNEIGHIIAVLYSYSNTGY